MIKMLRRNIDNKFKKIRRNYIRLFDSLSFLLFVAFKKTGILTLDFLLFLHLKTPVI